MFITVNQDLVNLDHVVHVTGSGAVALTSGSVLQCKDEAELGRLRIFLTTPRAEDIENKATPPATFTYRSLDGVRNLIPLFYQPKTERADWQTTAEQQANLDNRTLEEGSSELPAAVSEEEIA